MHTQSTACAACGLDGPGGDACVRCVCALLDDARVPTLQKIVRCAAVCRAIDAGLTVLPDDNAALASLCAPLARVLSSAEADLEGGVLELCFGIAALAESQLGAGDDVRGVLVHIAAEEMSALRARASASAQPAACKALLLVIGGLISAELAADADPEWLAQLAWDLADPRLGAEEGAVRVRVLRHIAQLAYGLPRLAETLGVDLELHLDAIERAEESCELAIEHMQLLRCLVSHHPDIEPQLAVDSEQGEPQQHPGRPKLVALLKRWLLGTAAMRLEACSLVRCACESSPLVLGAWCARDDLPEFVLNAMRSEGGDEVSRAVPAAALDALHRLAQLAGVHCAQLRAAWQIALLGSSAPSAGEGPSFGASFQTCLGHSASVLAGLLLVEGEHALTGEQVDRAWELLQLATSSARADGAARAWDGFGPLVRRMLPCHSVLETKRLLAVAANVCMAAQHARGAAPPSASSGRAHGPAESLAGELSLFALRHLPGGGGKATAVSTLRSDAAFDQDMLADACVCAAHAIVTTAARSSSSISTPGCSSAAPGASERLGGELERASAADVQQRALVELSYERLLAPHARRLHELSRPLCAGLLVLAEAVLLASSQRASSRAQRAQFARSLLVATAAGGRSGFATDGEAGEGGAVGRRVANLLNAVALHAFELPGISGSLPPLPSQLLLRACAASQGLEAPAAAPPINVGLLVIPHTPRLILQSWLVLSSHSPQQLWCPRSLGFAVELLYANAFVCPTPEPHMQHPAAMPAPTTAAPRELRAALAALFGAHEADLAAIENDLTLCRLLRLWNHAFGSAAIPAQCARTMDALLESLDSRRALGWMGVESVRFRFARGGASCLRALRGWLASEADFLRASAEELAKPDQLPPGRVRAPPAPPQGRGLDLQVAGREALGALMRPADPNLAKLVVQILGDYPPLRDEQQLRDAAANSLPSGDAGGQDESAWWTGLESALDLVRGAFAAGGHATVSLFERKGLIPALGRTFSLLAEVAGMAPTAAARVLPVFARALSLCDETVVCAQVDAADAEVLGMLGHALPVWLHIAKAAGDSRSIEQLLKTAYTLLDEGHCSIAAGGAAGVGADGELDAADGDGAPLPSSMDLAAMAEGVVALLAPPATSPSCERMQKVAVAALTSLAERAPAHVRTALLGTVARARAQQGATAHGLVLLLGSTDSLAVAQALQLFTELSRLDDPFGLMSAIGLSPNALSLVLLNKLCACDEPILLRSAVALLGALRDASPSFWRSFSAEAYNGLVLRHMVQRGLFRAPRGRCAAAEQQGRPPVVLDCTAYALMLLNEPRSEWLTAFLGRHRAEVDALYAQLGEPSAGEAGAAADARLREQQAALLLVVAPFASAGALGRAS